MLSKDNLLIQEAYISAVKKVPELPPMEDVTDNAPDTEGAVQMHAEEPVEKPVVVSLTNDTEEVETPEEHEHEEVSMAKTNLFSIFRHAQMLHDMLENNVELDTWMFQKIAVVADKLSDVAKVAEYHAAREGVIG